MKTKTLFVIICLVFAGILQPLRAVTFQQDNYKIYDKVDTPPAFPGGVEAMLEYLGKNIIYPVEAHASDIQGRVIVQFVIDKKGNVATPQIIRGIDPLLDMEALRVVSSMPAWSPGLLKGKAVNTRFTLPIVFQLTSDVKNTSTLNITEKATDKASRLDGFWQFKGQSVGGSQFQPARIYTAKVLLNGSFKTFIVSQNKTIITGEGNFDEVTDDYYIETITNHTNTTLIGKSQKMEYRLEDNMLYVKFFIEKSNLGTDLNMWYEEVWERINLQNSNPVSPNFGSKTSFVAPNYKTIEANIKNNTSNMYYPKLMKRFLNSDTTLTLEEKRHLYYGFVFQDNYSPYRISEHLNKAKVLKSKANLTEKDYAELIKLYDKALEENPFDTNALYEKMHTLFTTKRTDKLKEVNKQYVMIVETVANSGTGLTKETAFHVIEVAHEYALMRVFNLQRNQQQLIDHYDYLEFKPNTHGIKGFYFDISQSLNKLNKNLQRNHKVNL